MRRATPRTTATTIRRPRGSLVWRGLGLLLAATAFGCAGSHRQWFGRGPEPLTSDERVLVAAIEAAHNGRGELTLATPFCVSFADTLHEGPVPGPQLSRLAVSVHLIPETACPPTYASPARTLDPLGRPIRPRPPGYVDPYILRIWPPIRESDGLHAVRIEATHGTQGWLLYCEVPVANPTQASCKTLRSWVN